MRNLSNLAPCAFCNGEAILKQLNASYFCVECSGCRTLQPGYLTAKTAIAGWNRRHVEAEPVPAMPAEVREAIRNMIQEYGTGANEKELQEADTVCKWLDTVAERGEG